jgi:hypothetical protein
MYLWEILIPTVFGDTEKPIRTKHHKEWDKFVRKFSDGLTILHFKTHGQWICPKSKELIEERMIPVRIACEAADIEKIIQFTLKHYRQKVVMAYQISDKVLMTEAKDETVS